MSGKARQPVTKILLDVLANFGVVAVEFGELLADLSTGYGSARRHGGHAYVLELKQFRKKVRLREVLYQLQRSNYVKAEKIGSRLMIALTDKGRRATMVQRLLAAPEHRSGTYTVVIFDIPEQERASRLQFRTFLKQAGFARLQHSVWVSRRDSHRDVIVFIRQLKLQSWVNVYHATDLMYEPNRTL